MLPRRLSTLSRGECVQSLGCESLGLPLAAGPGVVLDEVA